MRAAILGHGQLVRILPEKRDMARSALRFGHEGGCAAGCELCRYRLLCESGIVGAPNKSEIGEQEHEH